MDIKDQVAIVTGAASGLGESTARCFAGLGARVAILDFDGDRAGAVAREIGGMAVQVDVRSEPSVQTSVDQVVGEFGAPRVLVNCAGIAPAARIVGRDGTLGTSVFENVVRTNLIGSYLMMAHAGRAMQGLDPLDGGERGVIINTASIALEEGQVGQTAYAASKGGIAALCLPAARDLAQSGIRVMAIAPGLFRTPMMEGLPDEVSAKITENIPFPDRLGDPGEFAKLAQHIVENAYLNGSVIRLDGAVRLPRK